MDDVEANDEAEAKKRCATSVQEASADDHEQPQSRYADADQVCQKPALIPEQKPHIQGDSKEDSQQVIAHDEPEVGQHVEQQEEDKNEEQETESKPEQNKADKKNDKAALTDDEQCHLQVPELGVWPE